MKKMGWFQVLVLVNLHHLFLVINSFVNFITYDWVGNKFHTRMVNLSSRSSSSKTRKERRQPCYAGNRLNGSTINYILSWTHLLSSIASLNWSYFPNWSISSWNRNFASSKKWIKTLNDKYNNMKVLLHHCQLPPPVYHHPLVGEFHLPRSPWS